MNPTGRKLLVTRFKVHARKRNRLKTLPRKRLRSWWRRINAQCKLPGMQLAGWLMPTPALLKLRQVRAAESRSLKLRCKTCSVLLPHG
jgi:hypothetical protein